MITFGTLFAQERHIKGLVSEADSGTPIEFANVTLLTTDSVYISGINSDEKGRFELKNIKEGNYLLSASYLGYTPTYTPVDCGETDSFTEILLRPSSVQLSEITVAADPVINKADRKLIMPSEIQLKSSTDGLDLLRKVQLSRVMVDPMTNEVSASGNEIVQLRINGVLVSNNEIAALKPDNIIRIEYHDDPGVRYGNASIVLDYITRRAESGGSIGASLMHNIGGKRVSANDMFSAKYSHKKSEFSANVVYFRRKQDWIREYNEMFVFPDSKLHRQEVGEPTLFDKGLLNSNMNYSLEEKSKYFFNVQLRYNNKDFPSAYEDRNSKLYQSDYNEPLSIYDHTTEYENTPALDIYYQRNLKNDQLLIFNVVGTYIASKNTRTYREQQVDVIETEIFSKIKGRKYSVIAEVIYERKLGYGTLAAGLKHSQMYTNNEYSGTTTADIYMNQAESNIYAEYRIKSGKWNYIAGVMGSRAYYSQKEENISEYSLQPSVHIAYMPNNNLYFRYRLNLQNNMPSLSYLNNVEQIIDPIQIRRGNPDLNSFQSLNQRVSAGYTKNIWGVDLLLSYEYQFDPIMESVIYENEMFIRTYENQRSFQNLSAEVTFKLKPWKDYISLSVTPKIDRFISKGNVYLHTYTMKELRVNLDLSYKNYVANFTTITPPRSVYGEQLIKSNQMYTIMTGYRTSGWGLMLGMLNPFTRTYRSENENWSTLNPVVSKIHTTNMNQVLFAKLSLNMNFGKQQKGGNKRISNSDNDSGIMSGRKQ